MFTITCYSCPEAHLYLYIKWFRFVLSGSVDPGCPADTGSVRTQWVRMSRGHRTSKGANEQRRYGCFQTWQAHHGLEEGLHGHGEAGEGPWWWRRSSERAQASVWWEAKFNFSTEFPIAKHGSLWLVSHKSHPLCRRSVRS